MSDGNKTDGSGDGAGWAAAVMIVFFVCCTFVVALVCTNGDILR